jgi:hypothetical protein
VAWAATSAITILTCPPPSTVLHAGENEGAARSERVGPGGHEPVTLAMNMPPQPQPQLPSKATALRRCLLHWAVAALRRPYRPYLIVPCAHASRCQRKASAVWDAARSAKEADVDLPRFVHGTAQICALSTPLPAAICCCAWSKFVECCSQALERANSCVYTSENQACAPPPTLNRPVLRDLPAARARCPVAIPVHAVARLDAQIFWINLVRNGLAEQTPRKGTPEFKPTPIHDCPHERRTARKSSTGPAAARRILCRN